MFESSFFMSDWAPTETQSACAKVLRMWRVLQQEFEMVSRARGGASMAEGLRCGATI